MKRSILALALVTISAAAFAQSRWNAAVQYIFIGNEAVATGGTSVASGRFNGSCYGGTGLDVVFRYKVNDHWSVQTGLGVATLGFDYSISSDYSLLNTKTRYVTNTIGFGTMELPASVIYSFNPNCRNWRWFVGGGVKMVSHGGEMDKDQLTLFDEASGTNYFLSQDMHVNSFTTGSGHLMVGREKLMKKGGSWSIALIGNKGAGNVMATSTVKYNVDGTAFEHVFTNYGDYIALSFIYNFRPFGSAKAQ